MVRHYLKSQLWVLLCGGAVGPIYLIVYFGFMSSADRKYVGWLLWAGWLVTVADVLVALALANYRAKATAKTAALEQHGALALARITGMKGTGTQINDQPLHVGRLLLKLQARDRTQLVVIAYETGLVTPAGP